MERHSNIEKTITITRLSIVTRIGKILNMLAKVRYDGTNARYVNHLPPKIDFEMENDLINDNFKDSVGRLAKRIKCFLKSVKIETPEPVMEEKEADLTQVVFNLSFAYNWASQLEDTLKDKMEEYLAYQVIALWLENTSPQDLPYYETKAKAILQEVRHTCEIRNNVIHTIEYLY